jgi:6-phosphogluconolactonase
MRWLLLTGVCFSLTQGFARNSPSTRRSSSALHLLPAKDVWILPTEQDVSKAVHSILENAANKAIAEKGSFALAIPGGSVLTVLSSLEPKGDWVSKTILAYVNHKCVPNEDLSSAIHAKARNKFLDRWGLTNVVTLDGTADAQAEAMAYQAKLEAIPASVLPRDADGFPLFDLCLIGVGDDGHIGSLYPGRDEINEASKWAIGVEMKSPPSISLTLPVMQRAKQSVVSAAGKSEKYPKGKASAMRMAVDDEQVTPHEFPACALRGTTVWIFDEPNGSETPLRPRATLDEFLAH